MSQRQSTNTLPQFVVIFRGLEAGGVLKATETLIDLGYEAFEVSLTTPDALESITRLSQAFGTQVLIGAGTVRSAGDVDAVREAGARMILSPVVNSAVIARAKDSGLLTIPGAYTPTEAATAAELGADLVKLFPAAPAGVDYFRLMREPLPDINFLVTGGVDAAMAHRFFDAGAQSVGVGHRLLGGDSAEKGDWDRFARQAAAYFETATAGTSP